MSPVPEFSRVFSLAALDPDGAPFMIRADAAERAAVARRFGLQAVGVLMCEGVITGSADGQRARVTGRLTAEVVQTCGVTLEPLPARIEVEVVRTFAADAVDEWSLDTVENGEIIVDGDADDAPDPIQNGVVDLGEMAAEVLALELEPFPRRADAEFGSSGHAAAEGSAANPFAALRDLRTRSDRGG